MIAGHGAQRLLAAVTLALPILGFGYLLWLLVGAPGAWALWMFDATVAAASAWVAWRRGRRRSPVDLTAPGDASARAHDRSIAGFFAVALVIGVVGLMAVLRAAPHGYWDAFAIWNLRARFLYRNPAEWTWAFDAGIVHRGYPPMLPAIVAHLWTLVGGDTTVVPRVLAAVCVTLAVGWLFFTLQRLRGALLASLALVAVLYPAGDVFGTPRLITEGAGQTAEVLLISFMTAAVGALVTARGQNGYVPRTLTFAGVCAGCAFWTKNEGELFALCILIAVFTTSLFARGIQQAVRDICALLIGLAPFVAAFAILNRFVVRASSEFFTRGLSVTLQDSVTVARHRTIIDGVLTFVGVGHHLLLLACLLVLASAAGLTACADCRRRVAAPAIMLVLMLCGYYAVYLISPYPLDWHVATSVDRLFMQVWPMSVLVLFLAIRSPGELRAVWAARGESSDVTSRV